MYLKLLDIQQFHLLFYSLFWSANFEISQTHACKLIFQFRSYTFFGNNYFTKVEKKTQNIFGLQLVMIGLFVWYLSLSLRSFSLFWHSAST